MTEGSIFGICRTLLTKPSSQVYQVETKSGVDNTRASMYEYDVNDVNLFGLLAVSSNIIFKDHEEEHSCSRNVPGTKAERHVHDSPQLHTRGAY
ncbi:hypothetical protein NPIL_364421 [Nephila pilipes]|uniref:Uncharacterized protein n=1 Tax=Nephila pilipes TaxID=299642 RepID=A0A8X6UUF1_NEPPI|nr:hypothetical protein NPIL_364421 [Nephila pilipes]